MYLYVYVYANIYVCQYVRLHSHTLLINLC